MKRLVTIAFDDIKQTLKIKNLPYIYRYLDGKKQYPNTTLGIIKIVEAVEEFCKRNSNIYIGGNILYGVGLNDCTRTSFNIVEEIKRSLAESS